MAKALEVVKGAASKELFDAGAATCFEDSLVQQRGEFVHDND